MCQEKYPWKNIQHENKWDNMHIIKCEGENAHYKKKGENIYTL